MNEPDFSIIIPTFNEEERLDDLLSYLEKNSGNFVLEIIIADGGSTDQTIEVAKKNDVKIVRCNRRGRAAQMNEGAGAATGSLLYFLHADTTPPPEFTVYINKAIKRGYTSGCFRLSFDDSHPALRLYGWFTRFSITLFRFGDQSLFVKKELFQKVGGFDETLIVMEDQKIVRELKKRGKFRVLNESVETSARRYKRNGEIRLQLVFTLIVFLYYIGADQSTLVRVYNTFIRTGNHA
ncbi:TIGR04283 family arsenosugar biosynthesis glycosyltransferase [Rhodohalobacter sp. 614A]|uniref:TIGR04283 family arsenosugar biosynthesis glycosyltransferase n=1 Tax=Rhodohalobacter sp. 614A TaxID=2908649 RepID=UPI001F02C3DA|nr:TIGR04283 family arsenosugar biosynthesis glycosyltransferase [Rhodohalobacter sp. 614A]